MSRFGVVLPTPWWIAAASTSPSPSKSPVTRLVPTVGPVANEASTTKLSGAQDAMLVKCVDSWPHRYSGLPRNSG